MSAQELSVPPGGSSIKVRSAKPKTQHCAPAAFALTPSIRSARSTAFHPISRHPTYMLAFSQRCSPIPGFTAWWPSQTDTSWAVTVSMSDPRSRVSDRLRSTHASRIRGVGRKLMEAMLVRAREHNFPGVRLLQSAFHNRSLALYSRLGFDAREPLSVMQGPPLRKQIEGCSVRPARVSDVEDCQRICVQVHGHDRVGELADAIKDKTAVVVERHERITGYATVLAFFGHAVAETNLDVQALIASAEAFGGPGIIVPTRNSNLFRWCLENGLRVVEPMTLMTLGLYNEPGGAYLPSILF